MKITSHQPRAGCVSAVAVLSLAGCGGGGLGSATAPGPGSAEMESQLGSAVAIACSQPQLAGGVRTSADNYARYLRKLLGGQLRMGAALGSNPVCTNRLSCNGTATDTPIPASESWQYSVGHWVESDPAVGDGAFSSGVASAYCGRLIRKAWMTGVAQ